LRKFFSNGGGDFDFPGFVFRNRGPQKVQATRVKLPCVLEQLYTGCTKKVTIQRSIVDRDGYRVEMAKVFEVQIKPGWAAGMAVTYERQGDEYPGMIPGDVVFVLEEKSHKNFRRDKDDLHYTCHLTLSNALLGVKVAIPGLDGNSREVNVPEIIYPTYVHRVDGAGMPSRRNEGVYGDLYVHFNILFPNRLLEEKRNEIRKAFEGVEFQKADPNVLEAVFFWSF